jgi:triacylglycerol esterase/lipase EstA (alpha/beta hydrolase family)
MRAPVLLVHGIWDDGRRFDAMRTALERAGTPGVHTIDLTPNDGRAPIRDLARQLGERAHAILRESGAAQLDVVGFSMGALVTRFWIQSDRGHEIVRRYVSIAGPHRGTVNAWLWPFAGVRDMRPGSALLSELESAHANWGGVEVHCFWTPFDLMIVPARSGILRGARSVREFRVGMHRWMITDQRVLTALVETLAG